MYLHPSRINVEREFAISDLQWCCIIVNEAGTDDFKLRDN
jgi:hypothetical protein